MKLDRLSPFLGRPVRFNGVNVYSPTIDQIESTGEMQYRINLLLSSFNKEKILLDLFRVTDQDYTAIEDMDDFEFLLSDPEMTQIISQALSFFVKGTVQANASKTSFDYVSEESSHVHHFVHRNNYQDFAALVRFLNGDRSDDEKVEFKNDRVKRKYRQMQTLKKKYEKPSEFELKDILSVLCNYEGNGISVCNISSLTIYQAFEHFERVNIKDAHKRTLALWANTYSLKEGTKLPEWITKTKL